LAREVVDRRDIRIGHSVCPHDCPSTCALDVELLDARTIGRVRGADRDNSYTAGVICEKVARYAERIHHPDRLLHPLKRKGPKGSGEWQRICRGTTRSTRSPGICSRPSAPRRRSRLALLLRRHHGPRHARRHAPAAPCQALFQHVRHHLRGAAWPGFIAGTGKLMGPDPREMAKSDLVVIWGTNPVYTQVNVMTHARARKERGAKIWRSSTSTKPPR
jgi:anaerobic selenocysteine-containing dehydrogenase